MENIKVGDEFIVAKALENSYIYIFDTGTQIIGVEGSGLSKFLAAGFHNGVTPSGAKLFEKEGFYYSLLEHEYKVIGKLKVTKVK